MHHDQTPFEGISDRVFGKMGKDQMERPLRVMSTLAVELALKSELLPTWRKTGRKVEIDWNPTGVLIERIRAGERSDVLIAIDQPIARLVGTGILRAGSVRPLARASAEVRRLGRAARCRAA